METGLEGGCVGRGDEVEDCAAGVGFRTTSAAICWAAIC